MENAVTLGLFQEALIRLFSEYNVLGGFFYVEGWGFKGERVRRGI